MKNNCFEKQLFIRLAWLGTRLLTLLFLLLYKLSVPSVSLYLPHSFFALTIIVKIIVSN